jgi:hypothetical protein
VTETHEAVCPYCWETIELEVDLSAGGQTYTEDCAVCCQPLLVRLTIPEDGGYAIDVTREND